MKLDKKERLALVNQFLILEKLYPEEADYYAQHRQAISEGYE
ncbi:YfbU family protein, partial [Vibrio sp. 10N.222.51.A6]